MDFRFSLGTMTLSCTRKIKGDSSPSHNGGAFDSSVRGGATPALNLTASRD